MKKIAVLFFVVMLPFWCFSEIGGVHFKPTESEKEFDVLYNYNQKYMDIIEVKNQNDVSVTQAFRFRDMPDAKYKAEVRYSLFTDTGANPASEQQEFIMYSMTCLMNATGVDIDKIPATFYDNKDELKKIFNCDYGFTTSILPGLKTDFCKNFKYVKFDFFYKPGQGIVMRAFLADDLDFWGVNETGKYRNNSPYDYFFDYFRFMDN